LDSSSDAIICLLLVLILMRVPTLVVLRKQ
jgi:hypothetical protein